MSFQSAAYIPTASNLHTLLVVNSFVFSRMDYCNAILSFCNQYSIRLLQRVQNCFARLVARLPRSSPTSSSIREFGWLRVSSRIDYKLCCLVHKCLYGSCPTYLKTLLSSASSSTAVVSLRFLHCPISKTAFVRRSFSCYAP